MVPGQARARRSSFATVRPGLGQGGEDGERLLADGDRGAGPGQRAAGGVEAKGTEGERLHRPSIARGVASG